MAKYDDLYPDATEGFLTSKIQRWPPILKFGPVKEGEEPHKCKCGESSDWVNATATQYVCSTECNEKLWDMMLNIFITQQIALS